MIRGAGAEPGGLLALSKQGWEEGPARDQEWGWQGGGSKTRQGEVLGAPREDVFKEMGGRLAVLMAAAGPWIRKTKKDLTKLWGLLRGPYLERCPSSGRG